MSENWREEWMHEKVSVAKQLASGSCGGGYPEAVLVLCCALSAIAAERWPGKSKDRKRFVELLHRYGDAALHPTRISVPLLLAHFDESGRSDEARALRRSLPLLSETQVLTGDDVDMSEKELRALSPALEVSLLRRFSYAVLLYEDTRSSYVHQYTPGSRSDSWGMGSTRGIGKVSYTNRIGAHEDRVDRLIYFSVEWLSNVALSAARNVHPLTQDPHFSDWWLSNA